MFHTDDGVGFIVAPTEQAWYNWSNVHGKENMNRKRLFDLLKVVVSLVLITLLLRKIGVQDTARTIRTANLYYLLGAVGLSLLGIVLRAWRWQTLLDALGVTVPLRELTSLNFIGFLFNNLLPSGIGGDAVKMYELSRYSDRATEAISTVLVDRFCGLIVLQAIALTALAFSYRLLDPPIILITVALFGGSLAAVVLLLNRRLWQGLGQRLKPLASIGNVQMVRQLYESIHGYNRPAMSQALGISLIFNVTLITMNYLVALGLGVNVSFWYFLLFVPITSVVLLLPISVGGLGVRESTYVLLFGQAGVSQTVAFSMSLLIAVTGTVIPGLIGGVIYIIRGSRKYIAEKG